MDLNQVLRDVTVRLPMASTAVEACQLTVATLARFAPATISVLLQVHDRLRCVAATGSWQVHASVPATSGIVGRVYTRGTGVTVARVSDDPDYLAVRPDVTAEVCVPVLDPAGRPIGVLDLQWCKPVQLDQWRQAAERIATRLGARIMALGGPPAETREEMMLRYAAALTAAPTEWDLTATVIRAARDVSALSAAVLVVSGPDGPLLGVPPGPPGDLETRVRAELAEAGPDALARMMGRAHRYGTGYTLGESGHPPIEDHEPLTRAGVRTLITVPFGPADTGGVLLVADERLLRPDPTTVNLIELLAGQAWTCLDRLRTLVRLRVQASSDPLTGLRHTGSFGERIATVTPGRTALLVIDVDDFKSVNDTYGHQAGDRLLVELARALETALRHGDELYRVGGDEFVAVIEVNRPDEAVRIAERLAQAARGIGQTISVGVALPLPGESSESTLRRADQALYTVKRRGRDGVHLAAA